MVLRELMDRLTFKNTVVAITCVSVLLEWNHGGLEPGSRKGEEKVEDSWSSKKSPRRPKGSSSVKLSCFGSSITHRVFTCRLFALVDFSSCKKNLGLSMRTEWRPVWWLTRDYGNIREIKTKNEENVQRIPYKWSITIINDKLPRFGGLYKWSYNQNTTKTKWLRGWSKVPSKGEFRWSPSTTGWKHGSGNN